MRGREYQYLWPLTGYLAARLAAMSRNRVMLSMKLFVVSLESMPSGVPVGLLLQGGSGMNVCILIECLPCSVLFCPNENLKDISIETFITDTSSKSSEPRRRSRSQSTSKA